MVLCTCPQAEANCLGNPHIAQSRYGPLNYNKAARRVQRAQQEIAAAIETTLSDIPTLPHHKIPGRDAPEYFGSIAPEKLSRSRALLIPPRRRVQRNGLSIGHRDGNPADPGGSKSNIPEKRRF